MSNKQKPQKPLYTASGRDAILVLQNNDYLFNYEYWFVSPSTFGAIMVVSYCPSNYPELNIHEMHQATAAQEAVKLLHEGWHIIRREPEFDAMLDEIGWRLAVDGACGVFYGHQRLHVFLEHGFAQRVNALAAEKDWGRQLTEIELNGVRSFLLNDDAENDYDIGAALDDLKGRQANIPFPAHPPPTSD